MLSNLHRNGGDLGRGLHYVFVLGTTLVIFVVECNLADPDARWDGIRVSARASDVSNVL